MNGTFNTNENGFVVNPPHDRSMMPIPTIDEVIQNLNNAKDELAASNKLLAYDAWSTLLFTGAFTIILSLFLGQIDTNHCKYAVIAVVVCLVIGGVLLLNKLKQLSNCKEYVSNCLAILNTAKATNPIVIGKASNDLNKGQVNEAKFL